MRRGFICGGSWLVDKNKTIDAWPAEEAVASIVAENAQGGGSGFNMAVDLKKLDETIPVAAMGLVGDDPEGKFLLEMCRFHGIDRRGLVVDDGAPTSCTDVYVARYTGKRTFFHRQGANARLSPDDFDFADSNARVLHLGLPGLHETLDSPWGDDPSGWVSVLRRARDAGLATNLELVSVAPARIADLARPCLPHLDSLIVNDFEIGAVAGLATLRDGATDIDAVAAAAESVLALGAMGFVAVHFPRGAVLAARDGTRLRLPSLDVPRSAIAGTNGAGDAYAAGLLYALHQGAGYDEAMRLAACVAAASLRAVDTTGAVDIAGNCQALALSWGWGPAI
ncbi:MAG: carbohydrate kinase family protein [Hyphomicrobiaceae bacterium]|nr:carbohydrate kinase family protein [Hyphomicrobiaceae bacterium]